MPIIENPNFLDLPKSARPLFAQAAEESFFSSPAWYNLMSRFGLAKSCQARLYLNASVQCQAGLLAQAGSRNDLREGRVLRSLTNAYSCEHGVLVAAGADRAAVLHELAELISCESPRWDRIILAGFDARDPSFATLALGLRRVGMDVKPFFDSGTWYEETTGLSFADYLEARPSVLRNTWRRKSAKAERSGQLSFALYDSLDGLERGIADYEAIYKRSWKPEEAYPGFMPALIRMAAEMGVLRLGTVHLQGQPAAAQFWIIWRGRACIYKLAHDERFDEYSLGTLLTMRIMERVLERDRPSEINFGRGDDPYKKLWLPKRRERWGLAVANFRTLRGFAHAMRQTAARIVRPLRPGQPVPPI